MVILDKENLLFTPVFFFFLCLFIFERDSACGGGAKSKGDTASEAGSALKAVSSLMQALKIMKNHEFMT